MLRPVAYGPSILSDRLVQLVEQSKSTQLVELTSTDGSHWLSLPLAWASLAESTSSLVLIG